MYMGTVGHACVWGQRMRSGAFPCHLPPNCSETGASLKLELTVLAALAHHSASRLLHPSLCVTSICCHIQLVMWILGIQARICLYSKHLRTEPSLQPTYTFLIRIENHPEVTVNILEDMLLKRDIYFSLQAGLEHCVAHDDFDFLWLSLVLRLQVGATMPEFSSTEGHT